MTATADTTPHQKTLLDTIKRDPQRRTLAVLGVLTILFLLLAIAALWQRSLELAPKYSPTPLFSDLDPNAVASIRVKSRAGAFTVRRNGANGWIVPEKGGFAADPNQATGTIRAVTSLEAIEPKTANPEWHSQLGLVAPEKNGEATELTLLDRSGKLLAALLIGKGADVVDATGRGAIYVRKPGENQSWLARGYLMAKPNVGDWLDKNLIAIGPEKIQSVDVAPPTGSAYIASRPTKDVPDFAVRPMPSGRELAFASAADAAADAIVNFAFDDAQPVANFDFSRPAASHVTHTFDGLVITTRIVDKNGEHWANVSAAAATPAAQAAATAINGRTGPWAFKLPDYKYTMFAATLESLLKPLTAPGAAPQTPAPAAPPTP